MAAAARDVLAAGREAVLKERNPLIVMLINDVLFNGRYHDKWLERRRELVSKANGGELARQVFGETAVMVMPELDLGTGLWPTKPKHRHGGKTSEGAVVTIRDNKTQISRMTTPRWRETENKPACPACYYERVQRNAKQILSEAQRHPLYFGSLPDKPSYERYTARTRQRRKNGKPAKYRAFPQADGSYFIITNCDIDKEIGNKNVITADHDKTELFNLLFNLCQTPDGQRIASSEGWGGNWQGTKGDGRVKEAKRRGEKVGDCVQLWTGSSLEDVAKALGIELDAKNSISIRVDALTAYQSLTDANIVLYERKTNRSGLDAFLEFLGIEENSRLEDIGENPIKPMSLSRENDTLGAIETPEKQLDLIFGGVS